MCAHVRVLAASVLLCLQGLSDAAPRLVDSHPPSHPIYTFYPRGPDRARTFPRGEEVGYVTKQYSDGYVPKLLVRGCGRSQASK